MTNNAFMPLKGEKVLIEAKVGKRIFGMYLLVMILFALVGLSFLAAGIGGKLSGVEHAERATFWGVGILAAILPILAHYLATRKRRYILTDKRIVIQRGGRIKKSFRSLSLESVHGVEKDYNFLYNRFGLATIDFFTMAAGSKTTKIKILSFSSTSFKFQWVDKRDADQVYELMQYFVVNGAFLAEEPFAAEEIGAEIKKDAE